MTERLLIAGNWKMNGSLAALAEAEAIDQAAARHAGVDVALAPPAVLIAAMAARVAHLAVGAQDCHAAAKGAHTGNHSAAMLSEAGAHFAIIGHSERRADQGETSADVAAKAAALSTAGMQAILCVGEPLEVRDAGGALEWVTAQLEASLAAVIDPQLLTIAYEPIWAIGTGRVAELADISAMHDALAEALVIRFGDLGQDVRVLYGGSVNPGNAADILALDAVGGALVGGASLTAAQFVPIIEAAAAA